MVEYEIADSGISQVLSQDDVDQTALFRRDGFAFFKFKQSFCLFVPP